MLCLCPLSFVRCQSKPRYVLDFLFVNAMGQQEPNAQYNSMATDLTVEVRLAWPCLAWPGLALPCM